MTIEDIIEYKKNAVESLKKNSQYATAKAVEEAFSALIVLDQIRWERDIAIGQLEELGISLGQKIEGVYLTREKFDKLFKDYFCMSAPDSEAFDT